MALVVMKFGGSSVADANKMKLVANKIIAKKDAGNKIVAVVSAPGDTTDDLLQMAEQITPKPPARELDVLLSTGEMVSIALLSMAIDAKGYPVISLTGPQAGIFSDHQHGQAKVEKIIPNAILKLLNKNNIVIVAGFQGSNPSGDITTLGRGGSDLTAVALAAALKADACEIYSDVEGIFTTDPRIVKQARKLDFLSYDEMLEMACSGAQVLQSRSVEVAKKFGVVINARGTFSDNCGTIIASEKIIKKLSGRKKMETLLVSGITFDKNQIKFTIVDLPDTPGVAAKIFGDLAKVGVNVDMIIQSAAVDKKNDISFTVTKQDVKKAQIVLDKIAKEFSATRVECDEQVAKVSVVGVGMRSHPGIAACAFELLSKNGINIEMISTSDIKISCIIDEIDTMKAVKALHAGFKLSKKNEIK
ncbi:MAG: aspartate kinase [Elusimicrobiota bacterium]|jgi:aspartate kinase|nr:aspartate kinase [Elusimicrobiota bacterium]